MTSGRMMLAAFALALGARSARAQDMYTAAKNAAQKAANAAGAHVEAEQHPEAKPEAKPAAKPAVKPDTQPAPKSAPTKPVPASNATPVKPVPASNAAPVKPVPASNAVPAAPAPAPAGPKPAARLQSSKPVPQLTVAKADTITVPAIIYREAYEYENDGRRDPFVSLLTTNELRPTLSDLKLSNILYDPSGRRSIAVMRDMTNNSQYRVTTGSTLGRMRVSAIHVLTVVFTIEEFGTSRMDSLVLRDTTKRGR